MATSRVVAAAGAFLLASAVAVAAQQVSAKPHRDRNLITAEEIEQTGANTAYQAVEKLRPEFLRRMDRPHTLGGGVAGRAVTGQGAGVGGAGGGDPMQASAPAYSEVQQQPTTAAVFVDGTQMGELEELKHISSNLVEEIRYLNGSDAEQRYGPRFSSGVIEVKLKNH